MEPELFVKACKQECDDLLASYAEMASLAKVTAHLDAAELSSDQRTSVLAALDEALTDAFYTIVLALNGSASLGGHQQTYKLLDGSGAIIADGSGRLEAAAWKEFRADDA